MFKIKGIFEMEDDKDMIYMIVLIFVLNWYYSFNNQDIYLIYMCWDNYGMIMKVV